MLMILNGKCDHHAARAKNCKYCPDCGKKVIQKWITVKCSNCGHYRKPPAKKYCFHCGSDEWEYQYYYESTIPDRMKAIAMRVVQTEDEKTTVWVSKT